MKNTLLSLVTICFISLIISSCSKEETDSNYSESFEDNFDNFSVTVNNGILEFPSYSDYDAAINYLSSLPIQEVLAWDNEIEFLSFEEASKEFLIKDEFLQEIEILSVLLNPDYAVVIGGYKFILNTKNSTVSVTSQNNLKAATKPEVYSMKENVLDIVLFDEEPENIMETQSKLIGPVTKYTTAGNIEIWIEDSHAGIYHDIKAIANKKFTNYNIEISVYNDGSEISWWRNKKKCQTVNETGESETSGRARAYFYQSTRKQEAYEVYAYFYAKNLAETGHPTLFSHTLYTGKNTSNSCR